MAALLDAHNNAELTFARKELERVVVGDEALWLMCQRESRTFLPFQAEAASVISAELTKCIRAGVPTALLRVGEGEGSVLGLTASTTVHPVQLGWFNEQFFDQSGIVLGDTEACSFAAMIREAIVSADIIGFRSLDRDGQESELEQIPRHVDLGLIRGALGMLYAREFLHNALVRGIFRQRILTSAWIHLALIPHLPVILSASPAVIVITGRPELKEQFSSRLGARLRSFLPVPVEHSRPISEADSHYRKTFPQVIEGLKTDLRGALVLVGAGLFGKLYCHVAKQGGAVAVDLGSAFDVLAGQVTRPAHTLIDIDALRWT